MTELLDIEQPALRHATLSLISILVSTLKGIEYMLSNGKSILEELIKLLKQLASEQSTTTNPVANSVCLRFVIAILQKMSIKSQLLPVFIEMGVIPFILDTLQMHYKSPKQEKQGIF